MSGLLTPPALTGPTWEFVDADGNVLHIRDGIAEAQAQAELMRMQAAPERWGPVVAMRARTL